MDVSRICADLVAINSENPPGRTAEVIDYIRTFLDALGISSVTTGRETGMCNLVTTGTGTRLLFCGHVDVVPAQDEKWTYPLFAGTIADGFVWGRGSTDMKGGCASILAALTALAEQEEEIPATIAFVCDEETGGENGIRHLLAHQLIHPCDCLIAEPSPARHPSIGQKGLCRLLMKFDGTPAHGSLYPSVGVSAIMEAVSLLEYVQDLHDREYPVDDPLKGILDRSSGVFEEEFGMKDGRSILKKLMYNPGVIAGGEKSNVVAQHCELELEIRVPWGCSMHELVAGIAAHAPHGTIAEQETFDPSLTDPACSLVAITCAEVARVYGGTVFPIAQWAASDARHLRLCGFPVIEYGPGEIATLHAVNERVRTEALEKASLVYQGIMQKYAEPHN